MAVIKRADADVFARQAVTLHLGDLSRQGDELVAHARQQAEQILADARTEAERLIAAASGIGHAAGLESGLVEGREKGHEEGYSEALRTSAVTISQLESAWRRALDLLETDRARMAAEARTDIVRLASVFAERVTKRALTLDATTVERQIEAVIAAAVRPSGMVLAVHPDDVGPARDAMPEMMGRLDGSGDVEIEPDATLERGSCVARLAGGAIIDASIDGQIDRLVEMLLPEEGRPGRDDRIVDKAGDDTGTRPAADGPDEGDPA